jgi:hypothetical protein
MRVDGIWEWRTADSEEPVWQMTDGRLKSPLYRQTCSLDGRASESVTFVPFQQIILTRTVHGVR